MIYESLRPVVKFCLKQFFSGIKQRGAQRCETGPVLFVSNHPNFALDALLIASSMRRQMWFLAKSTIFRGPLLQRFFESCHMVPVFRRMDSADGSVDNNEMFRVAAETLSAGRALVIFPEGISLGERKLQPLKTGAARIAFQSEEAANFGLGLKIQPVGLTYSDLARFRAAVTITFGEPIEVSLLSGEYERDAIAAVKALTTRIEDGLREVSVEVAESKHTELVEKITQVYRSRNPNADDHLLMKTISQHVEQLGDKEMARGESLRSRIDEYLDLTSVFAIDDSIPLEGDVDRKYLYLSMPFLIFGLITNYLPYKWVGRLAGRLTSHPVQSASLKLGIGVGVFFGWYLLLTILFANLVGGFLCTFIFLVVLIYSGLVVNNHLQEFKLFMLSSLWPGRRKPLEILKMIRDQLIDELESFR